MTWTRDSLKVSHVSIRLDCEWAFCHHLCPVQRMAFVRWVQFVSYWTQYNLKILKPVWV